jgi:membrane fusion protein, multidrug efflux system
MAKLWWMAALAIATGVAGFEVLGQRATSAPPPPPVRRVQVVTDVAVKKKSAVVIQALGNVTVFASVAIKARLDNEIVGVHFADGAEVKEGDLLITLDRRALEAQLRQAEGNLAKDKAQLAGAERDLRRYTILVPQGASPQLNLDNAKTAADTFRAAIRADEAVIKNLEVQLSYCEIRAPISGRTSQANVKVGNFVRSADLNAIATINQMQPVYVTFQVPQQNLPAVRAAMAAGTAVVEAAAEQEPQWSRGKVSMVENTVDPTTGLAVVRATMPNKDELLWPGSLVTVRLTVDTEDAVMVPTGAIQVRQAGNYVYVVNDGIATIRPVEVARATGTETAIRSGLSDGETVVTDGHLLLTDRTPVRLAGR